MKKLFFPCLMAAMLFVSCSDNDSETSPPATANLVKTIGTEYYMGSIESKGVSEFTDGKLVKLSIYKGSGQLSRYENVTYTPNGAAESVTVYNSQGIQIGQTLYTYDNLGRITGVAFNENNYTGTTNITYQDDTATVTQTGGSVKIFYINQDNMVYKEANTNDQYTYNVTYDGFNPLTAGDGKIAKVYTYLETPAQPGNFLAPINDMYGSFKANRVLSDGGLEGYEDLYTTKYIDKIADRGKITQYQYTFNEDNLPTNRKQYRDGELVSEIEFIYQ